MSFDQLRGAVQVYGKRSARFIHSAAASSSLPASAPIAPASTPPFPLSRSPSSPSLSLSPPDPGPRTRSRSRSRSPSPARPSSMRAQPAPSPMLDDGGDDDDGFDDPSDYIAAQPTPAPLRGTKRKLEATATAAAELSTRPTSSQPAASPAGKKPSAASRKLGQAQAQQREVEDVFGIDGIENDQHLSPSTLLFASRPKSSPPPRPLSAASRSAGTLGVRRQSPAAAKPLSGSGRPSPARAATASSSSLLSGAGSAAAAMQRAGASALPPRPLPSSARLHRTVSSPAKLSTTAKRQQVADEEKEATHSTVTRDTDLFKAVSSTQPPIRARTSVIPPFTAPSSTAKRALSAFNAQPLRTARKPLQATRSNPLPSSSFSSSSSAFDFPSSSESSSTSSSLHFSTALTGADRALMEELQYLLDGLSTSSPVDVRHTSALKLVQSFHRTHVNRQQRRGEGHQQFYLMRAHGGFAQLCSAFQHCVDDEVLCDAFSACAYLMSREKANAQCATHIAVNSLLDIIHGARRYPLEPDERKEREQPDDDDDDADEADSPHLPLIRSIRRRPTNPQPPTSAKDAIRALFRDEAVFTKTAFSYSPSLLALSSLLSFSADSHFKGTFARVAGGFDTLTSLVHAAFRDLIAATPSASSPASSLSTTSSTSPHLFHLQALLTILENLTHTHRDNQRLLLEAKVQPRESSGGAAGQRELPFDVQSFPQLYFALLQWCTHRVVHRLDQVDEARAQEEEAAVASFDEHDRSHLLLTTPSYTSLALLLCRLLVNLTNKSELGCKILYHPYADPVISLAVPSAAPPQRKTGVQIIADLVALCWYHPHLRSPRASPTSSPFSSSTSASSVLNAECDLFDLLTLSIGVVINTCEQSAVIREVLLENCHLSLHRHADGALLSIRPAADAALSPFSLHAVEAVRVSWLDCLIDVFAHSYLGLLALEQGEEDAEQGEPRPQPPQPSAAVALPQRYGSRAHTAPVIIPVKAEVVEAAQRVASGGGEQSVLVHRMLCSYAAMVIAVLAVHDSLAFHKVQAALRGRAENAHVSHRSSNTDTAGKRDDCLYDASPSPSASPPPPGREGAGGGGRVGVQVIFSLRLVVRLLNDFVLLHDEAVMSEESVSSLLSLITRLERTIKADSAFGV